MTKPSLAALRAPSLPSAHVQPVDLSGPKVTAASFSAMRDLLKRDVEILQPARDSFASFWKLTKPDMEWNWFYDRVSGELQQFFEDVLAGRQPRLMLFAPPRHGKSEGTSRRFPAWVFGKAPKLNIIACSYASSLANRMNRDVQRIMDTPIYAEVFPDSKLNKQNVATLAGQPLRNSDIFEIVDHLGSYRGAGVGGGISGQGFDIGVIDDPISNAAEALSEVTREGVWEWYKTTFYTRQAPLAGILLIMTRWHEDDLAGRLLKAELEGGEKWRVVNFPAIAEATETFRVAGEPLLPTRYPISRLNEIKGAVGSYVWNCMYQQRPEPRGGIIFARSFWKFYTVLPQLEEIVISVDCAFKDEAHNDYVAIQAWGRVGANKYLLRRVREHLGFAATVKAVQAMHALYPSAIAVLVEDKANGSAVVETIKDAIPAVLAIEPEGGKVARAFAIQPEQEAGNLWLPDPSIDPTIELFIAEAGSFPGAPHDDEVDSMTQGINWYKNRTGAFGMLQYMEQELARIEAAKNAANGPPKLRLVA